MKNFLFASLFLIGIILTSCSGGSDNAEIARLREENQALREQLNNSDKEELSNESVKGCTISDNLSDETTQNNGTISTSEGELKISDIYEFAYEFGVNKAAWNHDVDKAKKTKEELKKACKSLLLESKGIPKDDRAKEIYEKAFEEYYKGYNDYWDNI